MLQSVKQNRDRLVSAIQLEKQRLHQAPITLRGPRTLIVRHLRNLEAQLETCNRILRSV